MNAIKRLDDWLGKSKKHSASMSIDDGYGATCWDVTLYKNKEKIMAMECHFVLPEGADPHWHIHEGTLYVTPKAQPGQNKFLPGLEATINCAIDAAEKHWAN